MRIAGRYQGDAVLAGGGQRTPVTVELLIELDEYVVEGQVIGGYRTWAGRITEGDVDAGALAFATDLVLELPTGRQARCAVMDYGAVVGLGDPPFD